MKHSKPVENQAHLSTPSPNLQTAASIMAKAGASKGGLISAQRLTAKQRKERARKAISSRWEKKKKTIS